MSEASKIETYKLRPIGYVRRTANSRRLEIQKPFRPALKQLNHFSHVMVLWWAHKHDNEKSRSALQCEPPYAKGKVTGVFATRAEYRPNPIAMTTCKVLKVDEENGIVEVADIDAFDGTPIVDLKSLFPSLRPREGSPHSRVAFRLARMDARKRNRTLNSLFPLGNYLGGYLVQARSSSLRL